VNLRIAAVWGPFGRPDSGFFPLPRMVHAAVNGEAADLSSFHADDGMDMCYAKDCGRAIALLQTAGKLNHRTYNVGSGYPTKYSDVAAAVRNAVPDARITLAEGRNPQGPTDDPYLDLTRIRQDTGYRPAYDIERGVADYVGWLRSGNPR
jgi:UDP-glucose 4-epimerase